MFFRDRVWKWKTTLLYIKENILCGAIVDLTGSELIFESPFLEKER